jgi:hypothetical protein
MVPSSTDAVAAPPLVTLFEVPFTSAMSDDDLNLLANTLDLTTRERSSVKEPEDSLALARLDERSGLYLRKGDGEDRWRLVGQTWGSPPPDVAHGWEVDAAVGAQQLDPTVTIPRRLSTTSEPYIPDRLIGRASQKAHGRIRRHLAGLTGVDHITPKQKPKNG